jgi:hypothetical protein
MRWPQSYRYLLPSHVLFAPFTVMLVLATIELVAHDIHAYEMHACGMHAYEIHAYKIHARKRGTS